MPAPTEPETFPYTIRVEDLKPGFVIHYPFVSLSETEIIDFARELDPQPLHTDPEAAKLSQFGGLIASGLQPYITIHKNFWVKGVQPHFICGLGFDQIRLRKPVYPNMPFRGRIEIRSTEPKPSKGKIVVHWQFDILNEAEELLCFLQVSTYHTL